MELRLCPIGSAVEVRWLDLDADEQLRMRELGIREGALLHVVNCGAYGSKVVAIGADRFAIDGRTCACIAVVPQDENVAIVGSADLARSKDAVRSPRKKLRTRTMTEVAKA